MDTKVKGIVLKTIDYKDNDKLLTILTLEKGKIIVKARGVKKASSRLKAFCQSFCFADFELAESNGQYILTGVNEIENFFSLSTDIERFNFAFCVLEILDKICYESQTYVEIFIDTLKCLQNMMKENMNCQLVLLKYILNLLSFDGFKLNLKFCANCRSSLTKDIFLDLKNGEILCPVCKNFDCIELENVVFSSLKIISSCDYDKLNTVKFSNLILDKTLRVLVRNLSFRYEIKLNSIFL